MVPPGGPSNPYGCTPATRVVNTVVVLTPGTQSTLTATLTFRCANVVGASGQTYTIVAAADAHADDAGACAPGQIQMVSCGSALASDDSDPTDNRAATTGFRVK